MEQNAPVAASVRLRADGLVIHELADEILVYDKVRDQAHCLNQTAALVWRACDGRRAPEEIARKLTKQLAVAVPEDVVLLALVQLEEIHLLEQSENCTWFVCRNVTAANGPVFRSDGGGGFACNNFNFGAQACASCDLYKRRANHAVPYSFAVLVCNPAAPGGPKCF